VFCIGNSIGQCRRVSIAVVVVVDFAGKSYRRRLRVAAPITGGDINAYASCTIATTVAVVGRSDYERERRKSPQSYHYDNDITYIYIYIHTT